jgi:hypothetical protein
MGSMCLNRLQTCRIHKKSLKLEGGVLWDARLTARCSAGLFVAVCAGDFVIEIRQEPAPLPVLRAAGLLQEVNRINKEARRGLMGGSKTRSC